MWDAARSPTLRRRPDSRTAAEMLAHKHAGIFHGHAQRPDRSSPIVVVLSTCAVCRAQKMARTKESVRQQWQSLRSSAAVTKRPRAKLAQKGAQMMSVEEVAASAQARQVSIVVRACSCSRLPRLRVAQS